MLGIQAKQPLPDGGEEKAILRINADGGRVIVRNNGPVPSWTGEGHSPFGLYSTNGVVEGTPGILFRDHSDPEWRDGVRLYLETSVSGTTVTYALKAVARTSNSDKGTATTIHTWTETR
jgi:hypothetical protein